LYELPSTHPSPESGNAVSGASDQRYYASTYGRFNTPDPSQAGAKGASDAANPASWNRFSYVQGDPVNYYDPRGLFLLGPGSTAADDEGGGDDDEGDDGDQASPGRSVQGPAPTFYKAVVKELGSAMNRAQKALQNKKCADLFGVSDPAAVLGDLFRDHMTVKPITSPPGTVVSATTTPVQLVTANGTFNQADIVINDAAGVFLTGSANDQLVTLLHELGHAVNDIFGAGTSQIVDDGTSMGKDGIQLSIDNSALIKKNCLP
jgi:RHS repeat-associated protein